MSTVLVLLCHISIKVRKETVTMVNKITIIKTTFIRTFMMNLCRITIIVKKPRGTVPLTLSPPLSSSDGSAGWLQEGELEERQQHQHHRGQRQREQQCFLPLQGAPARPATVQHTPQTQVQSSTLYPGTDQHTPQTQVQVSTLPRPRYSSAHYLDPGTVQHTV